MNGFFRLSPSLARIIPFACYIAFLAMGPWLSPHFPDSRWFYALQIAVVAAMLYLLAPHFTELCGSLHDLDSDWLITLLVGVAVFVMWINFDQPWATIGESAGFDPRDAAGFINWPLAAVRIAGAALVVPVMEELFWRSYIMRWIEQPRFLEVQPGKIALKSVLISSVLFGIEHPLWLAGILAGLAYAWLYMRRGNLWSPVIAHGVTNFLLGAWVLYSGNWQFW